VTFHAALPGIPFGIGGTSANTDAARSRFMALLPLLAELAELQNAGLRLARGLRKTQRRCNALSKFSFPPTAKPSPIFRVRWRSVNVRN
jgi:V/A-type H+-transporting ATPase subunit D